MVPEAKLMFTVLLVTPFITLILSAFESRYNGVRAKQSICLAFQKGIIGLIGMAIVIVCLIVMLWRYT